MKQARYQNIEATLALLCETWPACFAIPEWRRRPLKSGIHHDVLAALGGAVTPVELGAALSAYTSNRRYRSRLLVGAERIDLAGRPAGVVTAKEAEHAAALQAKALARATRRWEAQKKERAKAAALTAPKRLSLSDLRAAAASRRIGAPAEAAE